MQSAMAVTIIHNTIDALPSCFPDKLVVAAFLCNPIPRPTRLLALTPLPLLIPPPMAEVLPRGSV